MNKKIKRDIINFSIIVSLIFIMLVMSIVWWQQTTEVKEIAPEIHINKTVCDSLKSINNNHYRNNADFKWTKAELDTIYFRKINNLLLWREHQLKKSKLYIE